MAMLFSLRDDFPDFNQNHLLAPFPELVIMRSPRPNYPKSMYSPIPPPTSSFGFDNVTQFRDQNQHLITSPNTLHVGCTDPLYGLSGSGTSRASAVMVSSTIDVQPPNRRQQLLPAAGAAINGEINSTLPQNESVTNPAHWEAMRSLLRTLYIDEQKELKEVMEIMQKQHNFSGSIQQYKKRFKKWGFRKYQNAEDVRDLLTADPADADTIMSHFATRTGRQASMAKARRLARRTGLIVPQKAKSTKMGSKSGMRLLPSPQIMSNFFATQSQDQQFEIVLRTIHGYFQGGFESGFWYTESLVNSVQSSKRELAMGTAIKLRTDAENIRRSFDQGSRTRALAFAARLCHNAILWLESENFENVWELIAVADGLLHSDQSLALDVLKHIWDIARTITRKPDHPLTMLVEFLYTSARRSARPQYRWLFVKLMFDEYSRECGPQHRQTIDIMDWAIHYEQAGVDDLRALLAGIEETYGEYSQGCLQCMISLLQSYLDGADLKAMFCGVAELQRRSQCAELDDLKQRWAFWASYYLFRAHLLTEDWANVEKELRQRVLPLYGDIWSQENALIRYGPDLLKALQNQGKLREASELDREIDDIAERIRKEVEI